MSDWLDRTRLMLGEESLTKLKNSHVLVAGLGGVGGFAAEFICRAGVGTITIVDCDTVNQTNRNRQIIALKSTEGQNKTDLMASRLRDINPDLNLNVYNTYLIRKDLDEVVNAYKYDYVIDAIDTLSPKVFFIYYCLKNNYKIVSSFGSGGKLNPEDIKVVDVSETYNCKLAYYVRKKLHKLDVYKGFKVVFSPEEKIGEIRTSDDKNKKSTAGTISYMPAMFGGYCASVVIRELIQ